LKNNAENTSFTGRAKTVIVYNQGKDTTAVISFIVVRASKKSVGNRLLFSGPAAFSTNTVNHINSIILPAADIFFNALNVPLKSFEISIVNLDVASLMDVGITISGYSADVPIFLAMLSAGLQLAIPDNILSTGHIASIDGDIRMVSSIPAKLSAAAKSKSVRTFIYPDIDQDDFLDSLSPQQKSQITGALAKAKSDLLVVSVKNVKDVLAAAFSDKEIVKASLRHNFYIPVANFPQPENSLESAIIYLVGNNENRFWAVLEQDLFSGNSDSAIQLLELFAQHYISRKLYPKDFGSKLLRQIRCVPPFILRRKIEFPLLSVSRCIQVSQFAQETDHEDVSLLFLASSRQAIHYSDKDDTGKQSTKAPEDIEETLQSILNEINQEALLRHVARPIDAARATFSPGAVTTNSFDEFNEIVTAFYVHMQRHTYRLIEPVDLNAASSKASALLEKAFIKKGGWDAARTEAETGVNGGIRFVLDVMTEHFKHVHQEEYLEQALKTALKPLDWEKTVSLTQSILKRLEHNLPQQVVSQPEKYVKDLKEILKTYVQSQDKLKSMLRSY
jgi:ATP-dependent Lon protease